MPARAFPCSAKPIACPPLRRATLAFALEPTKPRWLDGWTVGSCGSGGGLACSCGPCKLMAIFEASAKGVRATTPRSAQDPRKKLPARNAVAPTVPASSKPINVPRPHCSSWSAQFQAREFPLVRFSGGRQRSALFNCRAWRPSNLLRPGHSLRASRTAGPARSASRLRRARNGTTPGNAANQGCAVRIRTLTGDCFTANCGFVRDDPRLSHLFRDDPTLKWRVDPWPGSISSWLESWKSFGRFP